MGGDAVGGDVLGGFYARRVRCGAGVVLADAIKLDSTEIPKISFVFPRWEEASPWCERGCGGRQVGARLWEARRGQSDGSGGDCDAEGTRCEWELGGK